MFVHILWRAMLGRRRRKWCIFACIVISIIIFLIVDVAHVTKTTTEHRRRQNRIHQYFQNASHGSWVTSSGTFNIQQACVHPDLPLWSPDINQFVKPVQPIKCASEQDWVYTWNGKFFISATAEEKHGEIKCAYIPIVNNNDTFVVWKSIAPMLNGSDLVSDAFKVICKAADGQRYVNIHPCIMPLHVGRRHGQSDNPDRRETPNVFIFGFDSVSRQMFKRLLPKTHKFLTQILGASLLEGYNIVGDGTPQALMPLLTGRQETEIPEVRRGKAGAKAVDEVLTFIWTRYERAGYVTQWGEDMANVGTFNYRMLGFKTKPVHHYMRPFYLAAIPLYHLFKSRCLGSRPRHKVFLHWLKEGLVTNREQKFFTFGFFSEFSHENNNPLSLTDDDNVDFLKFVLDNGFLDNTILIVMSDHGMRFGSIRSTEQGKLEERMPYVAVRLPTRFEVAHPEKLQSLRTNTKRLTTPFDLHETLLEILGETDTGVLDRSGRGQSILREIPANRTCADAGIEPHWCACLRWQQMPVTDSNVSAAVNEILETINGLLEEFSNVCYFLALSNVTRAIVLETNEEVLKYKGSKDFDGRIADLSDSMKSKVVLFQITFVTSPGDGMFEATAAMDLLTGRVTSNDRDISRLNKYGNTPHCIVEGAPRLRPYCVCKEPPGDVNT